MRRNHTLLLLGLATYALPVLPALHAQAAGATAPSSRAIGPGLIWSIDHDFALRSLTLAPGAYVLAPQGKIVVMTVNGVQADLNPGRYTGDVRLALQTPNSVTFQTLTHPFRQALYLDATGIVADKSVVAAAGPYRLEGAVLSGARVRSNGESFNGIYVAGGQYTLKGVTLDMNGAGGNDFAGYGAALMADGPGTVLTVDGAKVHTRGAIRTAAVADHGARLIVKNSQLVADTGPLPAGYIPNSALGTMKNVPWMLGLSGNNRATNLLGDDTVATYINSSVSAAEWGVLSVDFSKNTFLTAIDCQLKITGASGYVTYAIGNSTNSFYGSSLSAPDYVAVITGGHVNFGASTPENVARLNTQLKLGLSDAERAALPRRATTLTSKRFGLMIWGDATVHIADDTTLDTGLASFLIKNSKADIQVDGSGGAKLRPANGVLLQLMDSDNPGPVVVDGMRLTSGVYHEPQGPAAKADGFDATAVLDTDVVATFAHIALAGDLYNSVRGGKIAATALGAAPPVGRNLVVTLDHATLTGRLTAAAARHAIDTITPLDWRQLGVVTNTPGPAVNNGVIVTLKDSTWTVTGTSYLSALTLEGTSTLAAPGGRMLTMTVDGKPVVPAAGRFSGQIVLQVSNGG